MRYRYLSSILSTDSISSFLPLDDRNVSDRTPNRNNDSCSFLSSPFYALDAAESQPRVVNFINGNEMNRETIYRYAAFLEGYSPRPTVLFEKLGPREGGQPVDVRKALYSSRAMWVWGLEGLL
ncbi:hypothetical protein BDZ97DRAFT_623063 [Flammula alnicola]|nr:hypothetical protein BDZ97DRAFT_623063 [Flammula alnicola]